MARLEERWRAAWPGALLPKLQKTLNQPSQPPRREEEKAVVPQLKVGGRKGTQLLLCNLLFGETLLMRRSQLLSSAQALWKRRGKPVGV